LSVRSCCSRSNAASSLQQARNLVNISGFMNLSLQLQELLKD
jgi:hypothetical protein